MSDFETSSNEEQSRERGRIRHEINNALTGIIGHTQILRLRGGMDENMQARVSKIEELALRIQALAAQLKSVE